jgi:hypothetical protein
MYGWNPKTPANDGVISAGHGGSEYSVARHGASSDTLL